MGSDEENDESRVGGSLRKSLDLTPEQEIEIVQEFCCIKMFLERFFWSYIFRNHIFKIMYFLQKKKINV